MTVRVRKPAVDIVEKISELDKPSGVAGEAMLRADTPQEQFNLIGAGRKNLIINGGFDVWQRGTSFSDDSFTADRWYINSGSATLTASRQAFTLGQTDVSDNPKYFLRMGIAGATTRQLIQKVEDVSQFSGKTVTLSYWAKSDVLVTPDVRLYAIYNGSGSEGIASDTNVLIDTAWKKYTHTFSLKSFAGKTIGASSCLQVDWTFFDDSTYVFDVANVQLELGKVATPFEHRSYGEELALCQRYYWQSHSGPQGSPAGTSAISSTGVQGQTSTGMINGCVILPVEMRTNGTVSFYDWAGTSGVMMRFDPNTANHYGETGYVAVRHNRWLFINSTSGTAASQVGAHVEIDAEL